MPFYACLFTEPNTQIQSHSLSGLARGQRVEVHFLTGVLEFFSSPSHS
jgi:hypothetical protein